jgi:D-alanyl-D-alanine carboxypeptidase
MKQISVAQRLASAPLLCGLLRVVPHRCLLQRSAAISFAAMRHAAAQDGVSLVPVSGYRSVEEQEEIYFGLKARNHCTATQR